MREGIEMGKTTLLKLASINKPVNRFKLYAFTRWRWVSTFLALLLMFSICSGILLTLTDISYLPLYVMESLCLSGLCTLLILGRLKKRWLHRSPLTSDDVPILVTYGRYIIQTYGKHVDWTTICAAAGHPEPRKSGDHTFPRFEREYGMEYVLGGILCAMVKEGGWESLPQEAINAMYNYPNIYKTFYSYY